MPTLLDFAPKPLIDSLIQAARAEDLGPNEDDLTSRLLVPAELRTTAQMRSRAAGRLCGAALLVDIAQAYDPAIQAHVLLQDGAVLARGSVVATFSGPLRSILAMERVALNFCTRLSGISTLTSRYVDAVADTKTRIYDTRKTTPGLRHLEKYAVACGGGHPHRMGLHDAVLVKDNHIAHIPADQLESALRTMVDKARKAFPRPSFIEIEVDTLAQLGNVLPVGPDIILLDNMDVPTLIKAVALRDQIAPRIQLEASGGVNFDTVKQIAQTGVERIAVGSLTHSAPALDLGLDID